MTANNNDAYVIFPDEYDERAEWEIAAKGWFAQAIVHGADGLQYPVSFIDLVRLQQDMEEYVQLGTPYFAEPGLIVLTEVTPAAMQQAVRALWRQGYFRHLKPLSNDMMVSSAGENEVSGS